MIMKIEATFCKMHEQFQAILINLERATEENRPIHEVEQELVEDLRILGRSAVEAFIERQGDGDIGEAVQHAGQPLKRLEDMSCERYFSAFGPVPKCWSSPVTAKAFPCVESRGSRSRRRSDWARAKRTAQNAWHVLEGSTRSTVLNEAWTMFSTTFGARSVRAIVLLRRTSGSVPILHGK